MPAIQISGLRKSYRDVLALDNLSLTVNEGSVFGFLGPNGAGKTTTIRILAGLARPNAGRAWVAGVEVTAKDVDARKDIGYLPQDPVFYPWMTPREFLIYCGQIFGLRSSERVLRTRDLLKLTQLSEAADRRIGGFSGGMRQRLGLAQALINRPKILLLDEPVSSLDPAGRKELLELIEKLRGSLTVFMSTHILSDVERICDSLAIIDQGRLITEGPQAALLEEFAVPALEIEVGLRHQPALDLWSDQLEGASGIRSVSRVPGKIRVIVDDIEKTRPALLSSLTANKLPIRRFEVVRPSLEDVFLRLVGSGESHD
jgi:ABC-2 type transport system ATP-binding protein